MSDVVCALCFKPHSIEWPHKLDSQLLALAFLAFALYTIE